jgi:two-component system cell cycle sensor histidine kinase/response regulator CckA
MKTPPPDQELRQSVIELKRAKAELEWNTAFLEAQVNSSIDGILVVDAAGKKILQNQRTTGLLKIPRHIAEDKDDEPQLRWVTNMTKNPGQFFEKVIYLNSHPDEISRDEIELKDGTMLDRYSAPVVGKDGKYYGRIWTFRDITEQRRIEQELKEAKVATVLLEGAQRYHFLADTVPLIIWTARPDGGLDYYNKAWFDYTGLTLAQTEDWGWRAVLHPDDLQRCVKRWTHSFTTGENYEIEYRFKRASDGTYRWFLGRATARRDEAGEIVQWVGTGTDIDDQKHAHSQLESRVVERTSALAKANNDLRLENADRKRAEETLRESEEKFRQLADNITDVFWIRSPDLREVHYVSPAFERIWGRPAASLYDDPHQWSDFIFPEDRQRVVEEFATLTGETRSLDIEYRIVRPDGGVRWVRVRGFQVRDAADRLIRHAGIVTDITERKQAESLARQSQERYRSLIDNAHDAIFTIAPDGTFTSLNPAVETIAGLSRAEWIGKPFAPMVHPDDLPLAREMFSRVLKGGRAPLHELRGHPGLNRPALMEMTLAAQKDENGKIIGVLGIGRDITARKQLEAQLFQSQKLDTVGKLAGGFAHEFNSILTAVIGQSELLLADLPTGSPLANNAKEISAAAHRAATLTRQLLAYGRKQFLQPETLDLNLLIANMEGVFRLLMGGIVDLRMVRAIGLQAVKADAGQIEQVITNLVINARDAMPNGGKLTLETANVYLDQEYVGHSPELEVKAGDYVMLAVSDTGIGMSADVKAHLFEPFFTTKCLGKGTGLGLSASYGIIKQSGGHISVYSEAGCGSTLKVYLPQVEPSAKTPVQRLDSSNLPRGTETILLVEDDAALREMAATLLRRLGYTVLAADNGIEALISKQRQGTGHIDLLFTDVVMPHMSGRELADRVRLLSPHTKILFTSAFTENAIVHQGVLDPGVALLQKPFTPSTLARKVREVLDHSSG